jgi:CRISPR system Cascade subunit CasC
LNFLNFHILQTIPFSNMNRDDAGSPKSVIYGGTDRARISSQALKRAARTNFEANSKADMTKRTKFAERNLKERVDDLLKEQNAALKDGMSERISKLCKDEIENLTKKKRGKKGAETSENKEGGKGAETSENNVDRSGDTLVWLAEDEVVKLAHKIAKSLLAPGDSPKLEGWIMHKTSSLTIAGFGRMFANAPEVQTEAAIQVAHAFTTHAAVTEVDYFTAVDDLREGYRGDKGSGHLDLSEYTSGVFYRYFNIDRVQLASNWSDIENTTAKERLCALLQSLILSLPSGKANATAPHTLPMTVIVQESTLPVSFADAFEKAIVEEDRGFAEPSRQRLLEYQEQATKLMPTLFGNTKKLDLMDKGSATLEETLDFAADWIITITRKETL